MAEPTAFDSYLAAQKKVFFVLPLCAELPTRNPEVVLGHSLVLQEVRGTSTNHCQTLLLGGFTQILCLAHSVGGKLE